MASIYCHLGRHVIPIGKASALRPVRLVNPNAVASEDDSPDWVYDESTPPEAHVRVCVDHPVKDDPYVWLDAQPGPQAVVLGPDEARALKSILDTMRYSGREGVTAIDIACDLFSARTALRAALVRHGWTADPQDPGESPTQLMRLALMDVLGTWGDKRWLRSRKRAVIERVSRALLHGI
jgi:hypothetical protein